MTDDAGASGRVKSTPDNPGAHLVSDSRIFRVRGWRVPDAVFIVAMLVTVVLLTALTFQFQPPDMVTPPWWPGSGIALGLGICFRRRYLWILAPAVAVVTLPVLVWAGRPIALAIALVATLVAEMTVGTLLLRGRRDRTPRFETPGDLGAFVGIALVSATLYGLLAYCAFQFFGSTAAAVQTLQTGPLKHAAAMALLTPLFVAPSNRRQQAGFTESATYLISALAVVTAVFLFDGSLPLAFLTFVPLVGVALRMSTRKLSVVIVGVASIAAQASVNNLGPFSFELLGPPTATAILEIYQLTIVAVFLSLSLVVGSERDMSTRLHESEELFRKSFNSSVAGKLMVVRTATEWIVERANPSGRDLLPGLQEGVTRLDAVLGEDAFAGLSKLADSLVAGNSRLTVKLADGRCLNMSVAVIGENPTGTLLVLHFHDVTESERLRQLEREELNRAAEVQRALVPGTLPATPGWTFGTYTIPAKQVGGDFYDVRVRQPCIVLSIGDVMGKGMDAGMLAAATRTALRSHDPDTTPSNVVTRAAGILDGDLRRVSAFVTLAYVLVNMDSGDFRFTDAGHGLHFVVRAGSGRIQRLTSRDMPVGLGDQWRESSDSLAPGDMILLVSDGVMDRWGGTLEGLEDAIRLCAKHDGISAQAVVDALCAEADEVLDGDDITAVALCRAG